MRRTVARAVVAAVGMIAGAAIAAVPAQAQPAWFDGVIAQDIVNSNCITSSPEYEVGSYVGEFLDETIPSPVIGEVFDIHIVVATLGNECAGTAPKIEFALPPGVKPALSKKVGIRCYLGPTGNMQAVGNECPKKLDPGTTSHPAIDKWYSVDPDSGFPAWPLPQGYAVEVQVPVKSSRILSGFGDTSGCVCVVGSVETINGISKPDDFFTWQSSSPSSGPYLPMFVFKAGPAKYSIPGKVKTSKAVKQGVPVKVTATAGGVKHKVTVKSGSGKTLGKGTYKASGPGKKTVKAKLTSAGKKAVKKGLGKATVKASSSGKGAKPAKKSGKVRFS